eukprot:m.25611 g.25611  ORF g.25611 m.25611 type:complete len:103 (-) comp8742_c0_seq1:51-359(-)
MMVVTAPDPDSALAKHRFNVAICVARFQSIFTKQCAVVFRSTTCVNVLRWLAGGCGAFDQEQACCCATNLLSRQPLRAINTAVSWGDQSIWLWLFNASHPSL